jgi:ABC-type lipoprotein release transport system permease subunit
VQASDPLTLAGVGAGLLIATGVATLVPAARIVRLNPADTLRAE